MEKLGYEAEDRQKGIEGAKPGTTNRMGEKSVERVAIRQAGSKFSWYTWSFHCFILSFI